MKENLNNLIGKHALIIEDNELNIIVLTIVLRNMGLSYDLARDGQEGLDKFNAGNFDIVLTDIQVPLLNGNQLAIQIRNNPDSKKAGVPIIALTASILLDDFNQYLSSGINAIVVKPFSQTELKETLEKYLFQIPLYTY